MFHNSRYKTSRWRGSGVHWLILCPIQHLTSSPSTLYFSPSNHIKPRLIYSPFTSEPAKPNYNAKLGKAAPVPG